MPANARDDPTERSIPAVRITKVIPTAMMPTNETCRRTLNALSDVRKPGSRTEKNAIRTSRKISGANRPRISRTSILRGACGSAEPAVVLAIVLSSPSRLELRRSGRRLLLAETGGQTHDPLLRRLGPRQLAGDRPFPHHQDANAHPKDFPQLPG